jgi:hypothetical protein
LDLQLTIPARETARATKIRPGEVRAWLDNLPYLNLERSATLASQQLRVMNRQAISAAVRIEVLTAFLASYQRIAESVCAAAEAERVQSLLKRFSQDIGFGYKIAVHELTRPQAGVLDRRHLSTALLGALHALGLQLLHYYSTYRRAPRALWNECLALYRYAHRTGRRHHGATLPGAGALDIDAAFRCAALLQLANPYRLPRGMAVALDTYLRKHVQLTAVCSDTEPPSGVARLALRSARVQADNGTRDALAIELDALLGQIGKDVATLKRGAPPSAIGLAAATPPGALLRTLQTLHADWHTPPSRARERQAVDAHIEVMAGLEAIYAAFNRGRCFDSKLFVDSTDEQAIDLGSVPAPEPRAPRPLPGAVTCVTINRSSGGVALSHHGPSAFSLQVGQLLALRRKRHRATGGWVLAVCRWLTDNDSGGGFDMGIEYVTRDVKAVVIETGGGSGPTCEPALSVYQQRALEPVLTLIVPSGRVLIGQRVTVYDAGGRYLVHCTELEDSGPGFERFVVVPE